MLIVKIENIQGQKFQAEFSSAEERDAWLAQEIANKSFGLPQRWVREIAEGQEVLETREVQLEILHEEPRLITEYLLPAEYQIISEDITVQKLLQKKLSDRKLKRQFGEDLIDKIALINDGKNLSVEQVDAFMSNPVISSIREHLYAGNLDTAVSKMQSEDLSAFFSAPEKAAVIQQINDFLESL